MQVQRAPTYTYASSFYLMFCRYNCTMPANAKTRRGCFHGYNPLNDAKTPVPCDAWERRVNKTSLKPKKKSDALRIPKTASQEPSTLMPGSPYRHTPTLYAGSRKSDPTQARRTGSNPFSLAKEPYPIKHLFLYLATLNSNDPNLPAKKAHLQWLHSTAIPNMDREL